MTSKVSSEGNIIEKERLLFLDYLRAIAVIVVMIDHNLLYYAEARSIDVTTYKWIDAKIFAPFGIIQHGGLFGVALFFLISGYVIAYVLNMERALEFFVKRFFRILPAFWMSILLIFLLHFVQQYVTGSDNYFSKYSALDYVKAAFFSDDYDSNSKQVNAVAWTLSIEIQFYVIIMLVTISAKTILTKIVLFIALSSASAVLSRHFMLVNYFNNVMWFMPILYVGVVFRFIDEGFDVFYGTLAVFVMFFLFVFNADLQLKGDVAASQMPSLYAALLIFLTARACRKHALKLNYPVKFLADHSYSLYLLHFFVGFFVMDLLLSNKYTISSVGGIAAIFGSAIGFRALVEKPSNNFGRSLAHRLGGATKVKFAAGN